MLGTIMNKTVFSAFFVCLFFNAFSMDKNPCAKWVAMMKESCKTGTLNQQLAERLEEEAAKAGCRRVDLTESKNHKDLFKKAGALSQCPELLAVRGSFPVYNFENCQYTKFFKRK